jgi:hypothetical protein
LEALHYERRQQQPEASRRPASAGEEVVGAGVMQHPGEAGRLPDAGKRVLADAADEACRVSKGC